MHHAVAPSTHAFVAAATALGATLGDYNARSARHGGGGGDDDDDARAVVGISQSTVDSATGARSDTWTSFLKARRAIRVFRMARLIP